MLVLYISHTIKKPGTYAYIIYGRASEQPTLIKDFDILHLLKVLEIEGSSQDSLQKPSINPKTTYTF